MTDPYWNYTKLLLHGENADGHTRVIDEKNHHISLPNGNVAHSVVQKKVGNTSIKLSNNSGYLSLAPNTDWAFGLGDFTIECWLYLQSYSGTPQLASNRMQSAGQAGTWAIYLTSTTITILEMVASGGDAVTATVTNLVGAFHHIAIDRANLVATIYVDGVAVASGNLRTNFTVATNNLVIGASPGDGAYISGFLDEFRITKGVSRYSENFTPSVLPFPHGDTQYDADYDKVVLHLHCNGENGNNTFVDQKGHTVAAFGGVAHTIAAGKFGGSCAQLGGVNGTSNLYLDVNTPDLNLGSGDFTIEYWSYSINRFSAPSAVFNFLDASGASALRLEKPASSQSNNLYVMGTLAGTVATTTANAWEHFAIVRQGGTIRVYKNGVQTTTTTTNVSSLTFNGRVYFAGAPGYAADYGYMDEIRIAKGLARYPNGVTFTPPVEPFPDFVPQKLSGTVRDPSGNPISRTVRSYRASDGLHIDTAVSDPTTGAFALRATDVSEHFVVVHDPVKNALIYDHITPVV